MMANRAKLYLVSKKKKKKRNNHEGLIKKVERCPTTRWSVPGGKFGLVMRMGKKRPVC